MSPCTACPVVKLDAAMATEDGAFIRRVGDLRFALKHGFSVTLDEILADEFVLLRVMDEEVLRKDEQAK